MLPELIQKSSLFRLLYLIDIDLAMEIRLKGCQFCDGPLHQANYQRQPRGELCNLPDKYLTRFSYCCGNDDCRRRTMPPSSRFMGRKVYWRPVVLIVMALKQNKHDSMSSRKLTEMFKISRQTLKRWSEYYRDVFPISPVWRHIRGEVSFMDKNIEMPSGIMNHFLGCYKSAEQGLSECLKLLASCEYPFTMKAEIITHKMVISTPKFV